MEQERLLTWGYMANDSALVLMAEWYWIRENLPLLITICSIIAFGFKLFYDFQQTKKEIAAQNAKILDFHKSFETTIAAMNAARAEKYRDFNRMVIESREKIELELKAARLEASNELLQHKRDTEKKIEEHGRQITELMMTQKEIVVILQKQDEKLDEIRENQRDNQKFRENFYRDQANKK